MFVLILAGAVTHADLGPLAAERATIRDARAIIATRGERVWPSYASAPFQVDVVAPTREFLFCRGPQPSFAHDGIDPTTGCSVQTRPRKLPVDLDASADFLAGGPVIAMGTQQTLGLSREEYILTLIHEDFHQFQSAHSAYEGAVSRLRPANAKDNWMLDYPFPYGDESTSAAFRDMSGAASAFLDATSRKRRENAFVAYVHARHAAQSTMSAADWSYYELQVGHEGIARWTEIAVAEGARDHAVSATARDRRQGLRTSLDAISRQGLGVWKRSVFYVFGPIEADMLTNLGQDWKSDYFTRPFVFGERLDAACKGMAGC